MSKRAEEIAEKYYPKTLEYKSYSNIDLNGIKRSCVQFGYEQAEKDLANKAMFSSGPNGFYYGKGYEQGRKDAKKDFGWVSVKDRLPDTDDYVLTCYETNGVPCGIAFRYYEGDAWWEDMTEESVCTIEYWMPIPKLPKLPEK